MITNKSLVLSVVAAALLTTGCSTINSSTKTAKTATTKASTKAAYASSSATTQVNSDGSFTLPNAKAGTCYGKVIIPEQYKTVTEKVLATQADTKLTIIPATCFNNKVRNVKSSFTVILSDIIFLISVSSMNEYI